MKRKISFRMWASVFLGGIWQWLRNLFSWKRKDTFWRVICAAITLCVVTVVGVLVVAFVRDIHAEAHWVLRKPISDKMDFVRGEYSDNPGWIANKVTGDITVRDVDWVAAPEGEDSLAVFSSKGKRGYLNRFSGRVAIAPQYDKAWVFSSGLAAVAKEGRVFFIDHSGKRINGKSYPYDVRNDYLYHGDYCIMNDEHGNFGLIDRAGNWKIPPKYQDITPASRNYWKMRLGDCENGLWYAFDDKAQPVNREGVSDINITEDLGMVYSLSNHLSMVVDFDGNRTEKFLPSEIGPLYYETDWKDADGNPLKERCTLYRYAMADGHEGLCTDTGETVTEPLFWYIEPISKDLYLCKYKDTGIGVIINSKGEVTTR